MIYPTLTPLTFVKLASYSASNSKIPWWHQPENATWLGGGVGLAGGAGLGALLAGGKGALIGGVGGAGLGAGAGRAYGAHKQKRYGENLERLEASGALLNSLIQLEPGGKLVVRKEDVERASRIVDEMNRLHRETFQDPIDNPFRGHITP